MSKQQASKPETRGMINAPSYDITAFTRIEVHEQEQLMVSIIEVTQLGNGFTKTQCPKLNWSRGRRSWRAGIDLPGRMQRLFRTMTRDSNDLRLYNLLVVPISIEHL